MGITRNSGVVLIICHQHYIRRKTYFLWHSMAGVAAHEVQAPGRCSPLNWQGSNAPTLAREALGVSIWNASIRASPKFLCKAFHCGMRSGTTPVSSTESVSLQLDITVAGGWLAGPVSCSARLSRGMASVVFHFGIRGCATASSSSTPRHAFHCGIRGHIARHQGTTHSHRVPLWNAKRVVCNKRDNQPCQ